MDKVGTIGPGRAQCRRVNRQGPAQCRQAPASQGAEVVGTLRRLAGCGEQPSDGARVHGTDMDVCVSSKRRQHDDLMWAVGGRGRRHPGVRQHEDQRLRGAP